MHGAVFLCYFYGFFFPLPASKVNATLFVARIHSAPLLFWCRADGRQVSTAREGQELLQDAAHTAREKLSKNTAESQSLWQPAQRHSWPRQGWARALADVNSAALCVPKLFLLSGPLPASPCLSFPMRGGRPVTPHLPICSFLIPLPGTFPHYTLKQHLVKIHWGGICSLNCWSELTWWIFV